MKRKKVVGYCRVSTLEQKKGYGIDIQVRAIHADERVELFGLAVHVHQPLEGRGGLLRM